MKTLTLKTLALVVFTSLTSCAETETPPPVVSSDAPQVQATESNEPVVEKKADEQTQTTPSQKAKEVNGEKVKKRTLLCPPDCD